MLSSPGQTMPEVFEGILEKHPRNSSEDVQLSHPLVDQSEELEKDLKGIPCSDP